MFFFSNLAQELEQEGRDAIESPTSPMGPRIGPEGYVLGIFDVALIIFCISSIYASNVFFS